MAAMGSRLGADRAGISVPIICRAGPDVPPGGRSGTFASIRHDPDSRAPATPLVANAAAQSLEPTPQGGAQGSGACGRDFELRMASRTLMGSHLRSTAASIGVLGAIRGSVRPYAAFAPRTP